MADVNYIITIRQEGGSGGKGSGGRSGVAPTPKGEGFDISESPDISIKAMIAGVKKVADAVIVPEINRVELRTGHETLQKRYEFAYSTINSAISIIGGGAMVGGAVGAAVGAAVAVGNFAYNTLVAQTNLDIARAVESEGIRLANIRATSDGNRSGKNI